MVIHGNPFPQDSRLAALWQQQARPEERAMVVRIPRHAEVLTTFRVDETICGRMGRVNLGEVLGDAVFSQPS